MITVTKSIEIDYGHTLPHHYGFCNQIHGHRGKIVAYFSGEVIKKVGSSNNGMVIDFSVCKQALMKIHELLDHGFAVWKDDTQYVIAGNDYTVSTLDFIKARNKKILVCDMPPTAEYLAQWVFSIVHREIYFLHNIKKEGLVTLEKIEFWETPNNRAILKRADWIKSINEQVRQEIKDDKTFIQEYYGTFDESDNPEGRKTLEELKNENSYESGLTKGE